MTSLGVDLVIPIHDPSRPIARAVASALPAVEDPEIRVNVVAHNLTPDVVGALLPDALRSRVRILALADGEPSPAGPFMHGIRSSDAEYVAIMGSDDTLEPGALRAWLDRARRDHLDALIPAERHASGAKVATPPVRPGRTRRLDAVRDRLAYRTAPLGLIRRSLIDELGLDMPPRLRSGSDQLFGLKLWFSGRSFGYGRGLPRYVVGADARERVTTLPRPATVEMRAIDELLDEPWVRSRVARERRAIVTKTVRVHVFSAALVRSDQGRWTPEDREHIAAFLGRCREVAPDFDVPLSRADRALVDALENPASDPGDIARALRARRRYGRPDTILTRDLRGLFAVDGPLRFMVAARLL